MYKIENFQIGLKETLPEEIDLMSEMEKQEENLRFITPYDKKRHLEVIDNKDEEHLTVWDKKTGKIVGFVILAGLQNPNLSLEFRRIVIQEKRKGIGRQCLQLIKKYCFNNLKFHRLWLDVFKDNVRAIYLYRSEGFIEEGELRDAVKQDEKYRSLLILSILENEFVHMLDRPRLKKAIILFHFYLSIFDSIFSDDFSSILTVLICNFLKGPFVNIVDV